MSIIEKGTYKFIDNPTLAYRDNENFNSILENSFSFKSKNITYYGIQVMTYEMSGSKQNCIDYLIIDGLKSVYGTSFGWITDGKADSTITLTEDANVSEEFYNWAITNGNLIKQGESEGSTKTLKTLKVNGKVLSKVNDKYLKNLNDSPIFAAKKAEVVSAGETWLINENPDITVETFLNTTITGKLNPLTANNTYGEPVKMYMIGVQQNNAFAVGINAQGYGGIMYGLPLDSSDTSGNKTWKFITENMDIYTVEDTVKLRTVTFDTAPTGELLTWLQANAVKQ